jgi:hypothetical protein
MSITIPTSITGGAQTGATSPVFTSVVDVASDVNGKQNAVTALASGTMIGARFHAISDPFTLTYYRPKNPRSLGNPNPVTGKYASVPKNTHSFTVSKGVNIAANNVPEIMTARLEFRVPAGSDSYDAVNVRAAVSALIGALNSMSAGIGDTLVTAVM